jgi:hypothetical protein
MRGRHGRVGDDASIPDGGNQVVPANHALTVSYQVLEEIEGLRFEPNNIVSPAQFAPIRVKNIIFEPIAHAQFWRS